MPAAWPILLPGPEPREMRLSGKSKVRRILSFSLRESNRDGPSILPHGRRTAIRQRSFSPRRDRPPYSPLAPGAPKRDPSRHLRLAETLKLAVVETRRTYLL